MKPEVIACGHYAEFVARLFKPMPDSNSSLMHAAIGVSGEAGELLDAIKKVWVYSKPLDRVNVIEELGDLEFYMQAMRTHLGIEREQTLIANVEKLLKRFPEGYTDAAAQARADKVNDNSQGNQS